MPQRQCINPECRRLIYDTEKVDELPDKLECQHCHRINIIRRAKPKKKRKAATKPIVPVPAAAATPEPEEVTGSIPSAMEPEFKQPAEEVE